MWKQPLLLLLSLGIGVAVARPVEEPSKTSVVKPTITSKSCWDIGCTVEQTPVWDEILGKCVCKWSLGPPPDLCTDIMCIAEMEVHYDPETGKCGCYWIPGLEPSPITLSARDAQATPTFPPSLSPSCDPATPCLVGTHPELNPLSGKCSCIRDNCPEIVCIPEMRPAYNATTGNCACQWIDGFGPPIIVTPPVIPISTTAVSLAVRETTAATTPAPTPATPNVCPLLCPIDSHLGVNPVTGLCSCISDVNLCVGVFCISEQHAVYNETSGRCECEWSPPFGPVGTIPLHLTTTSIGARAAEAPVSPTPIITIPIHTITTTAIACSVSCLPGYLPDPATGSCKCVPIVTAKPTTTQTAIACSLSCLPGYLPDPTTGNCGCVPIVTTTTAPPILSTFLPCAIRCSLGYHLETDPVTHKCKCVPDDCPDIICIAEKTAVRDPVTGQCGCQWIPGFGDPVTIDVRDSVTASAPEPAWTDPPACGSIYCISEMHPVYNATIGKCQCEWIPGLEPWFSISDSTSTLSATPTHIPTPSCQGTGLFCIPEMHLVYNATSARCECEWIDGFGPASIKAREPQETFVPPCGGLLCISEQEPVWSEELGRCTCKWILGLEPSWSMTEPWGPGPTPPGGWTTSSSIIPTIAARQTITGSPTKPTISPGCAGIFCISEMRPVFNVTSGQCECEWIPGLEPSSLPWIVSGTGPTPSGNGVTTTLDVGVSARAAAPTPTAETCFAWPNCISGYHLHQEGTNCTCAKDVEPLPCGVKCREGYILETSLDTGKCSCVEDPEPKCYPRCDQGQYWETTDTETGDGYCKDNVKVLPCAIRCGIENGFYISPSTGECHCSTPEKICVELTDYQLGTHSVWNNDTKICSCEPDTPDPETNCIAATTCLTGSQATWDAENEVCTCVPNAISEEEMCLKYTDCLIGSPAWNSETQQCTCTPDYVPSKRHGLEAREKDVFCCATTLCLPDTTPTCYGRKCVCEPKQNPEQTCLIATTCLTGSHPVWNSSAKKCACEPNFTEEICLLATTCLTGSNPVWIASTAECGCLPNITEEICLLATECITGSSPSWDATTSTCTCVPV